MKKLKDQRVFIVGGSSGMGYAVAEQSLAQGAQVIIASRSAAKLQAATARLGAGTTAQELDLSNEATVEKAFKETGPIDHLIIPGSSVKTGPLKTLSLADAEHSMRSKFFGPYLCAKYAQISPQGSIILFSGVLSDRPGTGMPILAAVNAAVEGLGRALALELAPTRVNVVSPGMTRDTGAYTAMPDEAREGMYRSVAEKLPVKRVGQPEDIAAITLSLMTNPFITGIVVRVDGGNVLV